MVRATIEFDEADYERVCRAADARGVTVERWVADEAVRAVPTSDEDSIEPFNTLEEWFAWTDKQKFSLNGWKWNRDELYDRKVLR